MILKVLLTFIEVQFAIINSQYASSSYHNTTISKLTSNVRKANNYCIQEIMRMNSNIDMRNIWGMYIAMYVVSQ